MIEFIHAYKRFGKEEILQNISLKISEGDQVCIIGGSGSGKSLLTRLILGLETLSEGKLLIQGQDTTDWTEENWHPIRKHFGVVFQGAALLDSMTIRQNIGLRLDEERKLTPSEIDDRVAEALTQVGLTATIWNKLPSEISGGMQKRVGMARAIIYEPEVLVFDEPTTGLDPINIQALNELMVQIAAEPGRTIITVTHNLATLNKLAKRVIMLHDNGILFNGSLPQLMASSNSYIQQFLAAGT
ncbi:MAG: ATP-binding cassette domain-containing protein [Bacteroidota bacterium]